LNSSIFAERGSGRDEAALRRYLVEIQRRRALIYNLATVVGITTKLLGVIKTNWLAVGLFIGVINGTALLFGLLSARGPVRALGTLIHALWLGTDVAIITWMVFLTGGSQSSWFPWYLAPVAGSAYVLERRATAAVMIACFGSYIGLVLISEPGSSAPARALTNLLMLFGAAFSAVMGISKLQEKRRTIAQLKDLETRRAADLETLAATLAERSRELDIANERLRSAAVTDLLTGLHNRRYLEEQINESVALARRNHGDRRAGRASGSLNSDLGFLMIDIDNLKIVNDTHGHEAGDRLLVWTAEALRRSVRETDSIIRWGGDEFMVLARQVDRAHLAELAERLRRAVNSGPFVVRSGAVVGVSCSIGFSHFPFGEPDLFSWEDVVGLADSALIIAKRSGRDLAVGIEPGGRAFGPGGQRDALKDISAAVRAGHLRLISAKALACGD